MARKIGCDYAVRGHEPRDHAHPVRCIAGRAMQQDQRRAAAAFQHGGRNAGQLQPALGDRNQREQLSASLFARMLWFVRRLLGLLTDRRGLGHGLLLRACRVE